MPAPLKRQKGRCLVAFPDNYIAIDIETTGRDTHFDEIIEIAGVKYEEGMEIARYQSFVKPDRDIDFFITELTGITNEMVSDAPSIDVVLQLFRDFIGNSILVGHNANFDINFLYDRSVALGLPSLDNDFVDTLLLSRRLFKDLENHELQTVAAFLAVETNPAHRALADCLCTAQCLQKMRAYADGIGGIPELKSTRYGQLAARITPENSSFNTDSPILGKSSLSPVNLSFSSERKPCKRLRMLEA